MGKRGPQAKWVRDRIGNDVVGLRKRPDGNFYFVLPDGRHKRLGSNKDDAIRRFRAATDTTVTLTHLDRETTTEHILELDEDKYWERVGYDLRTRPLYAASRTGIEQLGYLDNLQPPEDLTLAEIWQAYRDRKKTISKKELSESDGWWKQFSDSVAVKNIRALTPEHFAKYNETILSEYNAIAARHRFGKVKTIFNNAFKRGTAAEVLRRCLDLCKIFEAPKKPAKDAQPISVPHFRALLDAASDSLEWQCILTLSVQCLFYPVDVAGLQTSHLLLDEKSLVYDRKKTGTVRVAWLLDRTIRLLRKHRAATGNENDSVFLTCYGKPYVPNRITRNFNKLREKAGLPDSVKFSGLRDGGYSAALNGGASLDDIRLLAGHATGKMTDYYLKRAAITTKASVQAIERHYFEEDK